jgi:hypothetical protein
MASKPVPSSPLGGRVAAEGKLYLYVAIDRTSKFAFVQLARKTSRTSSAAFLEALIAAVPYKIHTVLSDNGIQFTFPPRYADGRAAGPHFIIFELATDFGDLAFGLGHRRRLPEQQDSGPSR